MSADPSPPRAPVPCVAVCLAAFNGVRWLDEQLTSIVAQREVDCRIFVSVDRSTDGTEALVERWAAEQPRISVLSQGQRFGSASLNFFRLLREVDFAGFDFVAFADQDDIWHEDKLRHSIAQLRRHAAAGVSTNVTAFWPDGTELLIRKDQHMGRWNHLFESAGPGCTYVFEADLASRLGEALRRDPDTAGRIALHDWLVYAWVRANGRTWWIDPTSTMRYRQHGGNEFGANRGLRAALSRWQKLAGGWYRTQVLSMARFVGQGEAWPIRRLQRLGLLDRLALIGSVASLRRLWRDRIVLALALAIMRR